MKQVQCRILGGVSPSLSQGSTFKGTNFVSTSSPGASDFIRRIIPEESPAPDDLLT